MFGWTILKLQIYMEKIMANIFNHADKYIEFRLLECGREKCIPNKKFSFTPKSYFVLHYVLSGQGYLEMEGKTYKLKKGHAFLIPPQHIPHYYPDENDPWTYVWIGFSGLNAIHYMREANLSAINPIMQDDSSQTLRFLLEKLHQTFLDAGYLDMNCLGLGYQVMAHILKIGHRKDEYLPQPIQHVNAAKDYIQNNYQFNISIADIASNVGVTTNYLANIFKKVTGMSPKQYLTNMRINRACHLLRINLYSIKEIAKQVGYPNQLHFSSAFKHNIGMSPIEFRRKESDVNEIS